MERGDREKEHRLLGFCHVLTFFFFFLKSNFQDFEVCCFPLTEKAIVESEQTHGKGK